MSYTPNRFNRETFQQLIDLINKKPLTKKQQDMIARYDAWKLLNEIYNTPMPKDKEFNKYHLKQMLERLKK